LFKNKPLLIVLTKTDLKKFDDLIEEDQTLLNELKSLENVSMVSMSNVNKEGVDDVKASACDILLKFRSE
jgi:nucleolar GTP-binding protein